MTCEGKYAGPDEATTAEVEFMRHALRLARIAQERGDTPVGSVLVYEGYIVGEGIEAVRADKDLTAHAEVRAVQEVSMSLKTLDLAGCTLLHVFLRDTQRSHFKGDHWQINSAHRGLQLKLPHSHRPEHSELVAASGRRNRRTRAGM